MSLPLEKEMKFGIMSRLPNPEIIRQTVEKVEDLGFDSLWTGDHIAFTLPISEPMVSLSQAAAYAKKLIIGTAVYLVPLRHPGPLAKTVATLDHMAEGRFIFGVGIGGEFPQEYELAGVPPTQRGARLNESIEMMKRLWSGERVTYHGKHFHFDDILMEPAPYQKGGPPIWCGGRQKAALQRAGALCDGYISYVVTPEMYAAALSEISAAAEAAGRNFTSYGTAHLLFCWISDTHEEAMETSVEHLSERYAMDFRGATKRYSALGTPADVAAKIDAYRKAGVRHVVLDFTGPMDRKVEQATRFMEEVAPLLR